MHCRLLTSTETQVPKNATSSGNKKNEKPDVGLIVAIAISIVIVIIFIIVARFMCLRKKKRKEKKKENGNENSLSFNKTSEGEILGMFQILFSLKRMIESYIFKYVTRYEKNNTQGTKFIK